VDFASAENATPIAGDAHLDLLFRGVTTKEQLNELEQANIVAAHRYVVRLSVKA